MYWGVAYSSGLISLGLYGIIFLKRRKATDLNILIFNLNITLILICLTYITLLPSTDFVILNRVGLASYIFSGLLIYTLPRYSHSTTTKGYGNRADPFFLVLTLLVLAALLILNFSGKIKLGSLIVFWVMGISITYSMFYMVFYSVKKDHSSPYIKWLGLFTLISLPILFGFDFIQQVLPFRVIQKKYFNYFPFFYFVLNLGLILSLRGNFWNKKNDNDAFISRFGITSREEEVMGLLCLGKSYREIGEELNISFSTVKSHTSNIYQKTNTKNKIELIELIRRSC